MDDNGVQVEVDGIRSLKSNFQNTERVEDNREVVVSPTNDNDGNDRKNADINIIANAKKYSKGELLNADNINAKKNDDQSLSVDINVENRDVVVIGEYKRNEPMAIRNNKKKIKKNQPVIDASQRNRSANRPNDYVISEIDRQIDRTINNDDNNDNNRKVVITHGRYYSHNNELIITNSIIDRQSTKTDEKDECTVPAITSGGSNENSNEIIPRSNYRTNEGITEGVAINEFECHEIYKCNYCHYVTISKKAICSHQNKHGVPLIKNFQLHQIDSEISRRMYGQKYTVLQCTKRPDITDEFNKSQKRIKPETTTKSSTSKTGNKPQPEHKEPVIIDLTDDDQIYSAFVEPPEQYKTENGGINKLLILADAAAYITQQDLLREKFSKT